MTMMSIDNDLCSRCGICADVCPRAIIDLPGTGRIPLIPRGKETLCLSCGQCEAFCPSGAIRTPGSNNRLKSAWDGRGIAPEILATYIESRRSIRNFLPRSVEKKTIESILDVTRYAASGGNVQPVEWLVIRNSKEVRRIGGIAIDWFRTLAGTSHPLSANAHRFIADWESGKDTVCRGAPCLLVAHIPEENFTADTDAIIALTHVDLLAPSFGLGTCWAGIVTMAAAAFPPMREALGLPAERKISYAMLLGYPRYKPCRIPLRKSPAIIWRE